MLYRYSYWNMLYHSYEWEYVGNNWEYYQYINGNSWEYIYQIVIIPLHWFSCKWCVYIYTYIYLCGFDTCRHALTGNSFCYRKEHGCIWSPTEKRAGKKRSCRAGNPKNLMEKNPSIPVWNFSQKSNVGGKIARKVRRLFIGQPCWNMQPHRWPDPDSFRKIKVIFAAFHASLPHAAQETSCSCAFSTTKKTPKVRMVRHLQACTDWQFLLLQERAWLHLKPTTPSPGCGCPVDAAVEF